MNLKIWVIKYWHWLLLMLVVIVFFMATASFNYFTQSEDFVKWVSPDEAANYNFTKLYAQAGRLAFFEKYNLVAEDIIHPRSYRSDFGWLKPVSFLGMILIYGQIAGLTSYKVIPFLTPLFAAVGIIFFFLLIKEIFGRKNGLISAMLLAGFPAYIYYSSRSMFHNVLFVVLAIIGLYFAVLMAKKNNQELAVKDGIAKKKIEVWRLVYAGLAGLFFGLATITRTSELIWLSPALIVIWLVNIRKVGIGKLLIFSAFFALALVPTAYYNKILYGSYWQGGYNEMNRSIINIAQASKDLVSVGADKNQLINNWEIIKNNLFYFGFHPEKSLKMFYYYFVKMFSWLFWPASFGLIIFYQQAGKWKAKHYAYLIFYIIISSILLFYYGSWTFHDNPDPKSFTIGNSYVRYWLPIYLGAMPLASIFILRLFKLFKKKYLAYPLIILIVGLIFFISIRFVLFAKEEGLHYTAQKQLATRIEYNKILSLTENNAVIITSYHDKLLFPQRKVVVGLFDDNNMIKRYAKLARYLPVYYYNFTFPDKDINYLNNKRLPPFGLRIEAVEKVTKEFTLYRLENVKLKSQNVK